jgi:hypothetical protein
LIIDPGTVRITPKRPTAIFLDFLFKVKLIGALLHRKMLKTLYFKLVFTKKFEIFVKIDFCDFRKNHVLGQFRPQIREEHQNNVVYKLSGFDKNIFVHFLHKWGSLPKK